LRGLSSASICAVGLAYITVIAALDYYTPPNVNFTLFYVLAVAFVGWGAGKWPAIGFACLGTASAVISQSNSFHGPQDIWPLIWNASSQLIVFSAGGWLTARATLLTRHLEQLAEQRAEQWKQEAEQHKTTAAKLADAQELNQKMLAASPMGIVAYKATGECVFCNEALARIAGGTVEQILQANFLKLESWRKSGLLRLAEEALEQNQARAGEFYDVTRFGKEGFVDAHVAPFVSGGERHLLHMCYDISERKRLEAQLLEISDREQARIGQDIHDGLCQKLVSLAFDANSLQRKLSAQKRPEATAAGRIANLLDESITESRQLSRGLFPIRLQTQGLVSALEELAQSASERFHLSCRFQTDAPELTLPQATATQLYRIAQEAVNNAVRHSQPRKISIELSSQNRQVTLTIKDDGLGLKPEARENGNGMGLHIMGYRARAIRGVLKLESSESGGTLVSCCVSSPVV
jgi:PAS domain S-box-containing protein